MGPLSRSSRLQLVEGIVECFYDMGANDNQVAQERWRLHTDDSYLEGWIEAINQPVRKGFFGRLLVWIRSLSGNYQMQMGAH